MKKYILPCLLLLAINGWCQDVADSANLKTIPDSSCKVKDGTDYIRQWFKIKPKIETNISNSAFLITPVIGSSPSTGFLVGLALQGAMQLPGSNMSTYQANLQYTAQKQLLIFVKNNIFINNNKALLAGDWRYYDNVEGSYGLGTNAPGKKLPFYFVSEGRGNSADSLVEPLRYRYYKVHQTISWRIGKGLYMGPGVHLDMYKQIIDEKLNLTPGSIHITKHYLYNTEHGFDPTNYNDIGASLNLVYDTRDNMANAYKGIYANLNFRYNTTIMGSTQNNSVVWSEFRAFQSMSKLVPQKVWAFWFIGNFTTSGQSPYLNLPALGYDQRGKTGRGYTIGRFRGMNMLYAETEYRFPISKCTRFLGGVVYVNATTTDDATGTVKLLEHIRCGFGAGIRLLFDKRTRMNIQVDYGRGRESNGVYFGATEVF